MDEPRQVDPPEAPYFVTAVARALQIMQSFTAERPELSFTEVGHLTGLSRATTRRILLTLRDLGFVHSDDGRSFRLAPRVLGLGYSYLSSTPLRDVARPHLEQVSGDLFETAGLAILDLPDIVYIAIAISPRLTGVRINLGTRFPAHATAAGRALLAHLPADALEAYLHDLHLDRASSALSKSALRAELEQARLKHWVITTSEIDDDLQGVAAPVLDRTGAAIASVSVSLHSGRQSLESLEQDFVPAVLAAAKQIESDLAGSIRQ
ncbi:IclR family transcriptional regulator domain-containing protein [Kribbella sp.]|uniref:IclR family transcriptional regulator domain-containing protein n=1 Tax=Kribbella sp. TaxID=1871183 RepID=UPI002D303BD8|nr:IclR family transcriptional regulator C-terminal domain-containing protein [Kribbella sp.]HZX07699.1 IclR family transcriptional regulator C-terminal domain-containing protein [Kribbella sp.]